MSNARALIEVETPRSVFRASLLRKGSRVVAQHPIGGTMEPGRVEELYPNGIMMVRWDDDPDYLGTCVPNQVKVIPEAEDPKGFLKRLSSTGPAFELVNAMLGKAGWFRRREDAWLFKGPDYRYYPDMPVREYNVWWDAPRAEWFFKLEGQKKHFGRWCGWHQLQGRAFKSGMELLKWIKTVDPSRLPLDFKVNEAEDPKAFLKRVSAAQADQTGEHQAERCFHLEASEQSYVLDWHGCITHYDWHTEETGGVYVFRVSGSSRV